MMPESEVRMRMRAYARVCGELHLIVLTGVQSDMIREDDLFLYPACAAHGLARRWQMYKIARYLSKKMQFDVISAQNPNEVGMIAYLVARKRRIPLQLQVHTDILSPRYARSSWKERIRAVMARLLLPRADCIRVVSKRIERSLITELGIPAERILLLPIFKDLRPYQDIRMTCPESARFAHYDFRIIAVGRFFEKEKNFCILIEMMRLFVKQCPSALLMLVGAGPDERRYRAMIKKYRLEKNVFIESWRHDLTEFYKCFDVFLMPSWYEGWGLAALETMAAGLPVVMTDVGLAGEVLMNGKNGIVVPVGNVGAFYDACVDLLKNPERRIEFANAGKQTIARLHPRDEEEYLRLYRESFERCMKKSL